MDEMRFQGLANLKIFKMLPIIKIKSVYEKALKKDGFRILVDRLWPRNLKEEEVTIDEWIKELAPTPNLRKWFGQDPEFWEDFKKRYKAELRKNKAVEDFIERHEDQKRITLIYAAKDSQHNHALVLQEYLQNKYDEYNNQ